MQEQAVTNRFNRQTLLLVAAFAAIYIFWGSTYLAIKYAVETLPTFLMAASRFLIAGAILYVWGRFSSDYEKPKLIHWRTSFIVGTLLLLGGNASVAIAVHYLPSSLAALLVATEPFWIVLLSWLWLGNGRPSVKAVIGLIIGFIGVYLLIGGHMGGDEANRGSEQLFGAGIIILGAASWAAGSIYGLRGESPKSSVLTSGMQMLSGGFMLLLVGTLKGEWSTLNIAEVSTSSWFGLAYLIVFGSLIAFTAYSWLLKNASPAMVSTYAYVNPVVAVFLGWLIAGESFTGTMLLGAGIIVSSVMLITSQHKEEDVSKAKDDIHKSQTPKGNQRTLSAST